MAFPTPPKVRVSALLALVLGVAGCVSRSDRAETTASDELARVASTYRPEHARPPLPTLAANAPLSDYIRYAVLNHPAVEAAFHDWRAAVAAIPGARAQPDPQLTFEADIMEKLVTFMPGVMFDFMNSGARTAMAQELSAGAAVAQRNYLAAIQRVATEVQRAWVELVYADEALELHTAMLTAFDEAAETAAADYVTGRGMATLETQVRLRNEAAMHHTEHHATAALRRAARARFKAALGLGHDDTNPPWPAARLAKTALPGRDELWRRVAQSNPELAAMRAMVDMAVANVAVAESAKKPNFTAGLMVDLKASPLMFRPTGSVSLPVWREKIAAGIEAARARHDAAVARVSAEEVMLAAELAQMLYIVQEADEMLAYIDETALPNLDLITATAAAGFETGMAGATMIAETQAMKIELQGRRLNALRDREAAVAELQLLVGSGANQP